MGLNQLFGTVATIEGATAADAGSPGVRPSEIPAGFDAILQLSSGLLSRSLAASLTVRALLPLRVRVPYQPELVSPLLRSAFAVHIRPQDSAVARFFLDVELRDSVLQTLGTPLVFEPPRAGTRGGSQSRGRDGAATALPGARRAMVSWTLAVEFVRERLVVDQSELERTARAGPRVGGSASVPSAGSAAVPSETGTVVAAVHGRLVTAAHRRVVVQPHLWQFWAAVDMGRDAPAITAEDPALREFLDSAYGAQLVAQTVAPLLGAHEVRLSPRFALARGLDSNQLQALSLPPIAITDVVLSEPGGEQVLSLCVSLGDRQTGVPGLVRPFLVGNHFAYYVSEEVFRPILAALWSANAIRVPIVGTIEVEMPLDENSEETGIGHVRLWTTIGDVLTESGVSPSLTQLGDPLRLVSEQTVQVLALWKPDGEQVSDLGELGEATTQPFVASLQLFDRPPADAQQEPHPLVRQLFVNVLRPLYYPLLDGMKLDSLSGFTSSALRAIFSRWRFEVPSPRPDVVGGTLGVGR